MDTPNNATTAPTSPASHPLDPCIRHAVEQYAKEVFLPVVAEVANKTRQECREEIARRDERIQKLEYWSELMGGALFDTIQVQMKHNAGLADAFDGIAKIAEREGSPAIVAALHVVAERIRDAGIMGMEAALQVGKQASPQQMEDLSARWAATVKGAGHGAK
jgi:hypothetical protein